VIAVETTNSMVRSTSRLVTVVGMKDVIVIDAPDALLVTRVGHCQSVKKVAEYLKSGNRVEVERRLAVRPKHTATNYGGMAPLFQSDSMEMVSASIAAGTILMLDPVDNREVMVSTGQLMAQTLKSSALLAQGQRMDLANTLPTMLVNNSRDDFDVILVTMLGKARCTQPVPFRPEATEAVRNETTPAVLYA